MSNTMTVENEGLPMDDEPVTRRVTFSPEPDAQRGRKRRRTPVPFAIVTTTKTLSGESATFRGRSRNRATSLVALSTLSSAFSSRNPSLNRGDRTSISPTRKRHLRFIPLIEQHHRRRDQSPSRSKSPNVLLNGDVMQQRRRRTRSRSREHYRPTSFPGAGVEAASLASPLRHVELVVDSEGSRDGEK